MNKKKIICTVLASTVILSSLLTGCKGKQKSQETVNKEGALKEANLTWYLEGGGAPKDNDLVNAEINKYLKEKTKLNVNLTIQLFDYASYSTKISTMIAAGDEADLVWTSTNGSVPFRPNVIKGSFIELNGLLDKYGKDIKNVLGNVYLDGATVNGKIYGVPVNKDRAHTKGMMFNKSMVDKYKFDISKVKTIDDLEPMLKVIRDNEKGNIVTNMSIGTGITNGPVNLLDFDILSGDTLVPLGLYGNNDRSNTKIFNIFDSNEVKEQLKTVRKFYNEGYIRKDAPTLKNDTSDIEGKQFVSFPQLKPNADKEKSTDKAQFVQLDLTKPIATNSDVGNSMMAITKNSKNPERAMMLLNLMYTDKTLLNMAVFGIEGKHYTKVNDNTIEPIKDSPFYPGAVAWRFGNQFLDYLKPTEDPKKWEILKKFNESSIPMNTLGFTFDSSNLQTEMAAIVNVSKEYQPVILTGAVDPDVYLPKYMAKLKEAGIEKVATELQKQYDEFLKTKKK